RAKFYRKHGAVPNLLALLFDSEREFMTYAGFPPGACARGTWYQPRAAASRRAQAVCAIIAVQGSPGCASHTAQANRCGRASKISAEAPPAQSMRNLWLIFAQTATVAVSVLFVVTTLKPEWLGRPGSGLQVVELRQATSSPGLPARAASYSDAVKKAVPSVVNIFTSKEIKTPRHPFLDDPLSEHFFVDRPD